MHATGHTPLAELASCLRSMTKSFGKRTEKTFIASNKRYAVIIRNVRLRLKPFDLSPEQIRKIFHLTTVQGEAIVHETRQAHPA